MRLRIEKWNDKVENEVVKHLNEIFGQEIQPDSVRDVSLLEKVTHTKFEINSICNKLTLQTLQTKSNFDCQIYKKRVGLEMGEN